MSQLGNAQKLLHTGRQVGALERAITRSKSRYFQPDQSAQPLAIHTGYVAKVEHDAATSSDQRLDQIFELTGGLSDQSAVTGNGRDMTCLRVSRFCDFIGEGGY